MALDFPTSPTNGQVYGAYVYDSSITAWRSKGVAQAATYVSDTAPSGATKGDMWYRSSDGTTYVYYVDADTSQWVEIRSEIAKSQVGLVPVVPTSIQVGSGSASVSSAGLVTFSGASSVSLNGCFSSNYTKYRVLVSVGDTLGATTDTLRAIVRSGTTNLTTGYTQQGVQQTGSNAPAMWNYTWSGTAVAMCNIGQTTSALEFYEPYVSGTRTTGSNISYGWNGTAEQYVSGVFFTVSTSQYDGLTFDTTAGTIFGKVQVYGYN